METNLRSGEVITGFFRSRAEAWTRRSLYLKVRDRASYEFALASAAVGLALDGDTVRAARIGLAAWPTARGAREAEASLVGRPWMRAIAERPRGRAALRRRRQPRRQRASRWSWARRTLVRALLQAKVHAARGGGRLTCQRTPRSLSESRTPRIDGVAKVTGAARYASDEPVANPAFAYLVTSAIARGRSGRFRSGRRQGRTRACLDILTHENVGSLAKPMPAQMDKRPDHDHLGKRPNLA